MLAHVDIKKILCNQSIMVAIDFLFMAPRICENIYFMSKQTITLSPFVEVLKIDSCKFMVQVFIFKKVEHSHANLCLTQWLQLYIFHGSQCVLVCSKCIGLIHGWVDQFGCHTNQFFLVIVIVRPMSFYRSKNLLK